MNSRHGRGAIGVGMAGPVWKMRREQLSPRATTHWDELAVVKAGWTGRTSDELAACSGRVEHVTASDHAPEDAAEPESVPASEPAAPDISTRDRRAESQTKLIESARDRIRDVLEAWTDEKHGRVSYAPIAVEHLGKALLWSKNPVLVADPASEDSLLMLAGDDPSIDSKNLRTIGLHVVLRRVGSLTGALSVPKTRLTRMTNVRNGAVHVGSVADPKLVLQDCLTVLGELIQRLGLDDEGFYGEHADLVVWVADAKKSELAARVDLKRRQARKRLERRNDDLGEAAFERTNQALADGRWSTTATAMESYADEICPECGYVGLLLGELDGRDEVDIDVSRGDDGDWEESANLYVQLTFTPSSFQCAVCRLRLIDIEELAESGLPAAGFDIEPDRLHPDFDINEFDHKRFVGLWEFPEDDFDHER